MKKTYKKKFLGILIALIIVNTLVACQSTENYNLEQESKKALESIKTVYSEVTKYPELEKLIIEELQIPDEYLSRTQYYYNYIDLNDDDVKEIFVVVIGPYTSGTGVHTAFWVHHINQNLYINQRFTLMQTPIVISDKITNGVHEIVVRRSGGGIDAQYVVLTCSDGNYTDINKGKVIKTLEGVKGTAIICNDITNELQNGKALTLK